MKSGAAMLDKIDWKRGLFRLWLVYTGGAAVFSAVWLAQHPDSYDGGVIGFLGMFALMVFLYSAPLVVVYKIFLWVVTGFIRPKQ